MIAKWIVFQIINVVRSMARSQLNTLSLLDLIMFRIDFMIALQTASFGSPQRLRFYIKVFVVIKVFVDLLVVYHGVAIVLREALAA